MLFLIIWVFLRRIFYGEHGSGYFGCIVLGLGGRKNDKTGLYELRGQLGGEVGADVLFGDGRFPRFGGIANLEFLGTDGGCGEWVDVYGVIEDIVLFFGVSFEELNKFITDFHGYQTPFCSISRKRSSVSIRNCFSFINDTATRQR